MVVIFSTDIVVRLPAKFSRLVSVLCIELSCLIDQRKARGEKKKTRKKDLFNHGISRIKLREHGKI